MNDETNTNQADEQLSNEVIASEDNIVDTERGNEEEKELGSKEKNEEGNIKNIGIQTEKASLNGKFSAGIQNFYDVKERGDSEFVVCPNCSTPPEENNFGTLKCRNCETVFFISSDFSPRISSYPNLSSEKNQEYKDLIAHISNFTILGSYDVADEFCNKAIEVSPATPQAWEYKAYCSYFLMRDKKFILDTNAEIIYRYLLVAKSHYVDEKEIDMIGSYKNISEKIAQRISNMIKYRIAWARKNPERISENELSELIYDFRICHRIHPYDSIFIESLINMYTGYDKESWLDLEIDEDNIEEYVLIDNTHLNGDLFDLIKLLETMILEINPSYKVKEFKGGKTDDEPRKISVLFKEKKEEYLINRDKKKKEETKKIRMQKELSVRTEGNKGN